MASTLTMRWLALAGALYALLASGGASAQAISPDSVAGWNPRSGDAWVDRQLDDMNRYGARYREPFVDEMVRYYGAPRELVVELLTQRGWAPGDIYYACAIGQILGRPCRYVVDDWERDHGQGWGGVAKRLGIEPGSEEFHRLKQGFVSTYDRWARPIALDAQLRGDFARRGPSLPHVGNGAAREGGPGSRHNAPSRRGKTAVGEGKSGKDRGKR